MTAYRSKPTMVEAICWTDYNWAAVSLFAPGKVKMIGGSLHLRAGKDGAQDWVPVPVGHWLVHQPGDKSDIWPVDADYFAAKYEPA